MPQSDEILAALLLVGLIGTILTMTGCGGEKNTGLPLPDAFAAIVPGETKRTEVIQHLGQPTRVIEQREWTNLLYEGHSASDITWYNLVAMEDDTVQFVSVEIPVDEQYWWSEVVRVYGQPVRTTASSRTQSAHLHIYAERGLAFTTISEAGQELVVSIAMYVPMTLDEYIDTYGTDY